MTSEDKKDIAIELAAIIMMGALTILLTIVFWPLAVAYVLMNAMLFTLAEVLDLP